MKAMTPTLVPAKSIGIRMTPNQPNGTGGDETEDTFSDLETNEPKIGLNESDWFRDPTSIATSESSTLRRRHST